MNYKEYFGMATEPFRSDLDVKELMDLPGIKGAKERIQYALKVGGVCVITGDVGLGKSTALRATVAEFHPSQTAVINVIAQSGSIGELYTMIAWELGLTPQSNKRSILVQQVKSALTEMVTQKKQQFLLCIDEANLLRYEVLEELHTLTQFSFDSKNMLTVVLCGQNSLTDKLQIRSSAALASRVVTRHHLQPLKIGGTEEYLLHHLKVSKIKQNIFDESAVTAIFQNSGGILRRINNLARGGLMAAALQKHNIVNSEHIRIAASEII